MRDLTAGLRSVALFSLLAACSGAGAAAAGSLTVDLFGGGTPRIVSSDGRIDCSPTGPSCFAHYDTPTHVVLSDATLDPAWVFDHWSNACSGGGPCSVLVDGDVRVAANFVQQQVSIALSIFPGGTVTSTPSGINCYPGCTMTLPYDSVNMVSLLATPEPGYQFVEWRGDCTGTSVTCTLDRTSSKFVKAEFGPIILSALAISPPTATIAVGGRQRFTVIGTFSDGSTRPLSADRSVDATDEQTCAITTNGTVQCFGGVYAVPTMVPWLKEASMLAAGSGSFCALFGDGTVKCEGVPMGLSNVTSVAAHANTAACALLSDATVHCWNSTAGPVTPAPLAGSAPPVAIAADAGKPACAVLADGHASCVGSPTPVPGVEDAIATAVGVFHACAIVARSGRVKCWGDNDWGQLGRGTTDPLGQEEPASFVLQQRGPNMVPIEGVVSIHSGDYFMCALTSTGVVQCWGRLVDPVTRNPLAVPLAQFVTSGAVNLAAGAFHACATSAAWTLSCWGFNSNNSLPAGSPSSMTPVAIAGITNIVTAAWSAFPYEVAYTAYNGVAAGLMPGTATIRASVGGLTATATLAVVNTATGGNIEVRPVDPQSGVAPVTVTFSGVTQPGTTSLSVNPGSPTGIPPGYALGSPAQYYEISTTAGYVPPITVCINYAGITFPGAPQLFHFEAGQWIDVTTTVDAVNQIVCGAVNSLSPFALLTRQCIPEITAVSVSPKVLWPPNHKMTRVTVSAAARDQCGPAPRCRIASVTSNEPVDGLGDGDTAPDWNITGDMTADLRAERSGNGTGRVYRIGLSCSSASGSSATRIIEVTVPIKP